MKTKRLNIIALLILMLVLVFIYGCSKDYFIHSDSMDASLVPFDILSGKLAFSGGSGSIFIINAENRTVSTLYANDGALIGEAGIALSPVDPEIAYSGYSATQYAAWDLAIINQDGTGFRRLTHSDGQSYHSRCPIWTHDGLGLIYLYGTANGGTLHKVNANGTENTRIADYDVYGRPSLSSDGNLLAFSKGYFYELEGIFLYSFLNDSLIQLTTPIDSFDAYSPVFSPDDAQLAFVIFHGPNQFPYQSPTYFFRIMIVNSDGTQKRQIIELPFESYIGDPYLTWSPDGEMLAFNYGHGMDGDNDANIYVVNVDGTGLTQVTHRSVNEERRFIFYGAPSWVP